MSDAAVVLLLVAGTAGLLLFPLISRAVLVPTALLIRTLSDTGASSGGSVLPSSIISAAIAVILIAAAVLPGQRPLPRRLVWMVMAAVGAITLWTVIGAIVAGGFRSGMLQESLRLVSVLAVVVSAYRIADENAASVSRIIGIVVIPAACVLLIGVFLRVPQTLNGAGRAVGTFSHANAAAAFMGVAALLCLALALRSKRKSWRIAAILTSLALAMTLSLGGILAWVVGVSVLFLGNATISIGKKVIGALAAVTIGWIGFFVTGISNRLAEFQDFDVQGALDSGRSGDSLGWRLINWSRLLEIWGENPLFGFGPGATSTYIQPLGAPPHSAPIQLLVEFGLVGLLFAIGFALLVFSNIVRMAKPDNKWIVSATAAVSAFVLVHASESNFIGYTATVYLVAMALGLTFGYLRRGTDAWAGETDRSVAPRTTQGQSQRRVTAGRD